ncbi:hypothetical protein BX666DRAFT_2031652 [Dichotomocladium elegans]|nr:hypothetical protein BX666DRAFT_2031652 [Dichotomocladium elegans]
MHERHQQTIALSPYGIILDSSPRRDWLGQPLMRFVHTEDLIPLCAGLSAACKQIMCPIRMRVRMAVAHPWYEWHELTIVECQKQWVSMVVEAEYQEQHTPSPSSSSWQGRINHVVENGVVVVAHALVALVQLLQEHGFQLKSIRPEMTDHLLQLLEWAGLVKDTSTARSFLNHLFDRCIAWYMDHAIKHAGPLRLCDAMI